jgi:hypothetical protein
LQAFSVRRFINDTPIKQPMKDILKIRKTVQLFALQFSDDWCSLIIGFVIALFLQPETVILREKSK